MIAQAKTFSGFGFFFECGGRDDMNKKMIRIEMIETLKKMDLIIYNELSQAIKDRVVATPEFIEAEVIGITLSRFPEVDTRLIIEAAWERGKKIVVPKCIAKTRTMDFRLITSFEDLETVYMDLLEPIVAKTTSIRKEDISLQIVPGVVFSDQGYRIGFGGGYYDRYMKYFQGEVLSLAFEIQTAKSVPVESHDIPVEKIITEKGIHHCRKVRENK